MNRLILLELSTLTGSPCVSVLMPTHPAGAAIEQDQRAMRELIEEVSERLSQQLELIEALTLVSRLEELSCELPWHDTLEGLVLYVNEEVATYLLLPEPVAAQVVIDERFATGELLATHDEVVALSAKRVRRRATKRAETPDADDAHLAL